ncbi:NUDIX hydrolase [Clostridium luticellarii]|uniref:Putative NUDIX hydrolase n=1 Tax=Clostridium luticellarii TaxID=1691940 RepID=A0A2T0BM00_9CLOT|nr:CoA pyrophosphatase [Clostridium luticellarii]MCI1945480.1 CoA pyrophosphatase [Clostridium luticellarii]MCI1968813.1 CoA pyrophosphatase [Clostridium luticellarii]MCI1995850.1 CoA pyrophosphatase [Clostridium luticellarii]MCI2040276.1 CoA pyrophosphatase [Clostridium luticellarii]PRR84812.1 putative NUDIX hydrolase [Clostridium luticellarii]
MIDRIEHIFRGRKGKLMGNFNKSAVAIPLCAEGGNIDVIFEVRALSLKHQPGDICFPGGKMETGETPGITAVRETMEELNLKRENIEVIGEMDYVITPYNFIMYPFVCRISSQRIIPNKSEVDHVFKVPLKFFIQNNPLVYEMPVVSQPGEKFPYELIANGKDYKFRSGKITEYFYQYKKYVIWGFTACIIKEFADIIKNNL